MFDVCFISNLPLKHLNSSESAAEGIQTQIVGTGSIVDSFGNLLNV